jgi:hypothetical protein
MSFYIDVNKISNKNTTLVRVKITDVDYDNDGFVVDVIGEATGEARRDPIDKNDAQLASDLALGRALEAIGKRLVKNANGRVKHNDDIREIQAVQKNQKEMNAYQALAAGGVDYTRYPGFWNFGRSK